MSNWGTISKEAQKALNEAAALIGVTAETATPEQKNMIRSTLVNMTMEATGMDLEKAFNMFWGSTAYESLKQEVAASLYEKFNSK